MKRYLGEKRKYKAENQVQRGEVDCGLDRLYGVCSQKSSESCVGGFLISG